MSSDGARRSVRPNASGCCSDSMATTMTSRSRSTRPPGRPTTVSRPRLTEWMEERVRGALTVLVAPAGYGKSVVVDQWAAEHRGTRVARVRFRPGDDRAQTTARLTAAFAGLA